MRKVSVCMAVYNGERFLAFQLKSILGQLGASDELIIVDDSSSDSSAQIARATKDPRVHLHVNESNVGPIKTFERALSLARGDVIFFSDQDDVWLENKLVDTVEALERTQKAAVVSDAVIIDENDKLLVSSYFARRRSGAGVVRNFYKNSYVGCCMAIDARMKPSLLPFPTTINQHDEWIGWASDFVGGVEFLGRPLLAYRRHGRNATPLQRSKWLSVTRYRMRMLMAIATRLPQLVRARREWRADL